MDREMEVEPGDNNEKRYADEEPLGYKEPRGIWSRSKTAHGGELVMASIEQRSDLQGLSIVGGSSARLLVDDMS